MVKKNGRKVLGTRERGRVAVYSSRQIGWLEHNRVPYTRFVYRGGRVVRKVRRNVD